MKINPGQSAVTPNYLLRIVLMMSEKQKVIQQMLDMQRRFIDIEQMGEFSAEKYYDFGGGSELAQYKKTYDELATRLVDLAHEEKGSHR